MNHQSYSPVVKHFAWLWCSPTASEALSYRLNLYRSMPPDLPSPQTFLERCALYVRKKNSARCARRTAAPTLLYICVPAPPFFNFWVCPCYTNAVPPATALVTLYPQSSFWVLAFFFSAGTCWILLHTPCVLYVWDGEGMD